MRCQNAKFAFLAPSQVVQGKAFIFQGGDSRKKGYNNITDHHTRKSRVCIMSVLCISDTGILGRGPESSKQEVTFGPGLEG